MIINWPFLFLSVLLLWIPSSLTYSRGIKDELSDPQPPGKCNFLDLLWVWQNWVDGIRAYVGTYVLVTLAVSDTTEVWGQVYFQVLAVHGAVLSVAVALQVINRYEVYFFTAPVFFLWGITFVLTDWVAALYAVASGIVAVAIGGHIDWKFLVTGVVLGISGYFLVGFDPYLLLNVLLVLFPVVFVYGCQGHLVFLSSEVKSSRQT